MKAIVETKGEYGFIDPYTGKEIHHNRPTVVDMTAFVQDRMASNEIDLLLKNLPKEASDDVFIKVLEEFNTPELKMAAIANFASLYGLDEYGNSTESEEDKAARLAAEAEKAQRLADEAAAAEAQRLADEQAEADRIAAAAAESQRLADEQAARQAQEEADRLAAEEAAKQNDTLAGGQHTPPAV